MLYFGPRNRIPCFIEKLNATSREAVKNDEKGTNEANYKKTYITRRKPLQYGFDCIRLKDPFLMLCKIIFSYVRKVLTTSKNPVSSRIQSTEGLGRLTKSAFLGIPKLKADFLIEHTKFMKVNKCKRQTLLKNIIKKTCWLRIRCRDPAVADVPARKRSSKTPLERRRKILPPNRKITHWEIPLKCTTTTEKKTLAKNAKSWHFICHFPNTNFWPGSTLANPSPPLHPPNCPTFSPTPGDSAFSRERTTTMYVHDFVSVASVFFTTHVLSKVVAFVDLRRWSIPEDQLQSRDYGCRATTGFFSYGS